MTALRNGGRSVVEGAVARPTQPSNVQWARVVVVMGVDRAGGIQATLADLWPDQVATKDRIPHRVASMALQPPSLGVSAPFVPRPIVSATAFVRDSHDSK